jgi:hypothetical protein
VPIPAEYRPATASLEQIRLAVDGWTAGAVDTQGTLWRPTTLEGWWESAPIATSIVDRPLDHGGFDGPSFYRPRVITVNGIAVSPDLATNLRARDIVASVCADPSVLYPLVVTEPGRPSRRCMVRMSSAAKARDVTDTICEWSLIFVAPDPRRYDNTETVIVLSPPTGAAGGITVPLTVPFSISTTGMSTSSATVTNAGTIATRPVVEFAGPLVDPQIANVGAGKSLSMTITLAAGDVLTADFDRRTLLLNGSASRSSTLTASAAWWELAPGGNDLAFTAGGGNGTATVRYRSAWL